MAAESAGQPAAQPDNKAQQSASSAQAATADKTTTDQPSSSTSSLMDHLGLPADVQAQIAPKQSEADKGTPDPNADPNADGDPDGVPNADDPNAAADADPNADGDPDGEPNADDSNADPNQRKLSKEQKRINRLTRQKHELESKLDAYAAQVEELQEAHKQGEETGHRPVATAAGILEGVTSLQQLDRMEGEAEAALEWLDEQIANNPDGITIGEGEKARFVNLEDLQGKRRAAARVLRQAPRRREKLRAHQAVSSQFENAAQELYPELTAKLRDKTSEDYQVAQSILRQAPWIEQLPGKTLILARYIAGCRQEAEMLQRAAEKNGNRNSIPPRRDEIRKSGDIDPRAFAPRVPLAPHTANPPSRQSAPSSQKKVEQAKEQLVTDPDSSSALTNYFAAREEAKASGPSTGRRQVAV